MDPKWAPLKQKVNLPCPKGAVPAAGGGFPAPETFPSHRHSHTADLCHCSHGLAAPPRPRRNTLLLTQTSRRLPSHQLSHTQALPFTSAREHSPRISSLWALVTLLFSSSAPPRLLFHRLGGNNLEGTLHSGKAVAADTCLQIRPLTHAGKGVVAKPGNFLWGLKSTFPLSAAQTLILLFLHFWSGFEEASGADLRVRGRDGRVPRLLRFQKSGFSLFEILVSRTHYWGPSV